MSTLKPRSPYEHGRDAYYLGQSDGCPYPDGIQRAQWRNGWNDARNHWEGDEQRDARWPSVRSRIAGSRKPDYPPPEPYPDRGADDYP
jgi:ribosome modulation factor